MNAHKKLERKKRAMRIIRILKKLFPRAAMELQYANHWELLVAVMLSAQCTDKKVNEVTARLFKKYRTLDDYLRADQKTFEQDIRQTGFYRSKTKHILAAARLVQRMHGGKIPDTMEEMLALPGVARKTANVVLGNAYGIVEGIAVDTHVARLAQQFDLTDYADPVRIEKDLMEVVPKKDWFLCTYLLISYGRTMAPAKKKDFSDSPLARFHTKST